MTTIDELIQKELAFKKNNAYYISIDGQDIRLGTSKEKANKRLSTMEDDIGKLKSAPIVDPSFKEALEAEVEASENLEPFNQDQVTSKKIKDELGKILSVYVHNEFG